MQLCGHRGGKIDLGNCPRGFGAALFIVSFCKNKEEADSIVSTFPQDKAGHCRYAYFIRHIADSSASF
jgi:hypothetical protein